MTVLLALVRKELVILLRSPVTYLTLTLVGIVTALLFFDYLRHYNQLLFLNTSATMGGFELGTIPDYVNLRDQVFLPLLEQLALTFMAIIPLITMRSFAEERGRGTDELLLTTELTPEHIIAAKFFTAYLFVALLLLASIVYPAASMLRTGIGLQHLFAVYLGLLVLGIGLASIGLACSAFTDSQLIAAIAAYAIAFVLYDLSWVQTFSSEALGGFLVSISLYPHFIEFAEGLIAVQHLAYFVGISLICAGLARLSLDMIRVK